MATKTSKARKAQRPARRPNIDWRFFDELVRASEGSGLELMVRETFAEEATMLRAQLREFRDRLEDETPDCPTCLRRSGLSRDEHRAMLGAVTQLNRTLEKLGVTRLAPDPEGGLGKDFTA